MDAADMTKEQVLQEFFSGFGLTAFQEDAVPTGGDKPQFPYITYEVATDSFGVEVPLSACAWYRSTSWSAANAKAREVAKFISRGGKIFPCDDGGMWIKPASPFVRSMGDDSDDMIKRKVFNFTIEYITEV